MSENERESGISVPDDHTTASDVADSDGAAGRPDSAGGHDHERRRAGRILRRYLFTGLLVILPISISVFVLWQLFFMLDHILGRFIIRYCGRQIPGIGLVVLIAIILAVGAVASNFIGRRVLGFWERFIDRIPLVRWIYGTTKTVFATVLHEDSTSFRRVVLIEFPHKGIYSLAFITAESGGRMEGVLDKKLVSVFLPTTPNPTSGYFLLVPEEDVQPLNMSVQDGLRYVVSAGVLADEGRVGR
jgi:uncharacterized membrane protein